MKHRWGVLYFVLAVILLFSLFTVPQIARRVLDDTKGKIVTVEMQYIIIRLQSVEYLMQKHAVCLGYS